MNRSLLYCLAAGEQFPVQEGLVLVVPKVFGIGVVGVPLVEVAEEVVEALAGWARCRFPPRRGPICRTARCVARSLQHVGHGHLVGPQAHFGLAIAADGGVAGVLAGHEAAARRRADGAAGVGLGEAHALGGQAVQVRREDVLLAVAAEVAVAEVVGQDEDDVGARRLSRARRRRRAWPRPAPGVDLFVSSVHRSWQSGAAFGRRHPAIIPQTPRGWVKKQTTPLKGIIRGCYIGGIPGTGWPAKSQPDWRIRWRFSREHALYGEL